MRKGTFSFVLILAIGAALITFVGLPAATGAADPENRGALITHYDPELKHLVVLDPERGQLAVYDVRSEARVLGVRNVDRDLDVDAAAPTEATLPDSDVPGEDPPRFTRPKGSIRVRSGFETRWQGEHWTAEYYVQNNPAAVLTELRQGLRDWKVVSSSFKAETKSGIQSGDFIVRDGTDNIEIKLRPSTQFPGWVWVRVTLDRKNG
jgi:hypothetical protein